MQALGLGAFGAGTGALLRPGIAQTEGESPARNLIWLSDHGSVFNSWKMDAGLSGNGTEIASLTNLDTSEWSPILAPLAPYAAKLNLLEGMGRAPELDYEKNGGSGDRHTFGQTMVLTCVDSIQNGDIMGGATSIDQVIGNFSAGPGRMTAPVYGRNHYKGYSFTDSGRPTPLTGNPNTAFDDLMGLYVPRDDNNNGNNDPEPTAPAAPTRSELIRAARASVLDVSAQEYDAVSARLGSTQRLKLEEHRAHIRDLELTFEPAAPGVTEGPAANVPLAACDPDSYNSPGNNNDAFGRIAALAFSCDIARSIFIIVGGAERELDLGGRDFHQDVAHGANSDADAARLMTEFNLVYARQFASLVGHLDSISDGNGTLLDNTMATWLTELASGPHDLDNMPYVIAGGSRGFLKTGQYVRYDRANRIEGGWDPYNIGPSNGQLYVTMMHAMGMSDTTFGVTNVQGMDISGPLSELLS